MLSISINIISLISSLDSHFDFVLLDVLSLGPDVLGAFVWVTFCPNVLAYTVLSFLKLFGYMALTAGY